MPIKNLMFNNCMASITINPEQTNINDTIENQNGVILIEEGVKDYCITSSTLTIDLTNSSTLSYDLSASNSNVTIKDRGNAKYIYAQHSSITILPVNNAAINNSTSITTIVSGERGSIDVDWERVTANGENQLVVATNTEEIPCTSGVIILRTSTHSWQLYPQSRTQKDTEQLYKQQNVGSMCLGISGMASEPYDTLTLMASKLKQFSSTTTFNQEYSKLLNSQMLIDFLEYTTDIITIIAAYSQADNIVELFGTPFTPALIGQANATDSYSHAE